MTKKTTQIAIATIATSLMASLAPVPAQSTSLPISATKLMTQHDVATSLTLNVPSGQIFLPLDEATEYLNSINKQQHFLLTQMVRERQNRGNGSLFTNISKMKRLCTNGLKRHVRVKEAIKLVMRGDNINKLFPNDLAQQAKYRTSLVNFGKAVAQNEFILRDTLSCIQQSMSPEKTAHVANMPDQDEMDAWISAEHGKFRSVTTE